MKLNPFKPRNQEQLQNDAVDLILHHLKSYNFNHTQKALVIREVKNTLQKEVETTIEDAITANSI